MPAAAPVDTPRLASDVVEHTAMEVPLGPALVAAAIPRSDSNAVLINILPLGLGIVKFALSQSFRPRHVQMASWKQ